MRNAGDQVIQANLKLAETDQDYSTSAMVCLKPSEALRKVYADMHECTEDVEDLHITLAYLGEFGTDIQFSQEDAYFRGLYDLALHSGYRGLTGKINGFGVFMNPDTNVLVALWDLPGINEFRYWVLHYLQDHVGTANLRRDDHSFSPHMTLAYQDTPIRKIPRLPRNNPEGEVFDSVWLVWAMSGPRWVSTRNLTAMGGICDPGVCGWDLSCDAPLTSRSCLLVGR